MDQCMDQWTNGPMDQWNKWSGRRRDRPRVLPPPASFSAAPGPSSEDVDADGFSLLVNIMHLLTHATVDSSSSRPNSPNVSAKSELA